MMMILGKCDESLFPKFSHYACASARTFPHLLLELIFENIFTA